MHKFACFCVTTITLFRLHQDTALCNAVNPLRMNIYYVIANGVSS